MQSYIPSIIIYSNLPSFLLYRAIQIVYISVVSSISYTILYSTILYDRIYTPQGKRGQRFHSTRCLLLQFQEYAQSIRLLLSIGSIQRSGPQVYTTYIHTSEYCIHQSISIYLFIHPSYSLSCCSCICIVIVIVISSMVVLWLTSFLSLSLSWLLLPPWQSEYTSKECQIGWI